MAQTKYIPGYGILTWSAQATCYVCILCYLKVSHLLIYFPYDLRNSRTDIGLTEIVNHNFIKNAAMADKKKALAVLNH